MPLGAARRWVGSALSADPEAPHSATSNPIWKQAPGPWRRVGVRDRQGPPLV
jgi:hypothetical protein